MPKIIKEYNRLPDTIRSKIALLNDLSGKEWVQLSRSVITYGGPIAPKRKEHGAAFPIELARHFVQLLSKKSDTVLDPFLGVGTVADACTLLQRTCVGFEINDRFYEFAIQGIDPIDCPNGEIAEAQHRIYKDSCLNLLKYLPVESIDLIVTSPPYADLLHKVAENFAGYTYGKNIYRDEGRDLATPYSDSIEDFGNLDWEDYKSQVGKLMGLLYQVAKPGSFNVWVVRDFRDMENHIPYVNLHSAIIELAISQGWVLTDIAIWDQTQQRKLVKLGGPKARRFYFNIGHSFIVIFRKNIKGEKFRNI